MSHLSGDSAACAYLERLYSQHRHQLGCDAAADALRLHVRLQIAAMTQLIKDHLPPHARYRYRAAAAMVAEEVGIEPPDHAQAHLARTRVLVDIASSVLTSDGPDPLVLFSPEDDGGPYPCVPLSTLRALAAVAARSTGDLDCDDVAALLESRDLGAQSVGQNVAARILGSEGQPQYAPPGGPYLAAATSRSQSRTRAPGV